MKMNQTLATVCAMFLVTGWVAAKKPSDAADKKRKPKEPSEEQASSFVDKKLQGKERRAYHLAEKEATREFLNSPDGVSFKNRIAATDDEINAVYEKNLNVFREESEKGKRLVEEMERQVQLLKQKRDETEAEFEKLRKASPVYRAMYEKHLKSQLGQAKGKVKPSKATEDIP